MNVRSAYKYKPGFFFFCTWMFWLSPTVLCVFTFLIHTRTFFPTPPAPPIPPHPHLSCTTSVSCEGPSGSITTFLSLLLPPPPCVNSLQIPVALQAAFMFSSLFPLFHVLWCTEKECTQLSKLHLCLEDCMGSRCQVSLNPPNSSYTQNSTLKMQISWFWWIPECPKHRNARTGW